MPRAVVSEPSHRGARWLAAIALVSLVAAGWLLVTPGTDTRVDTTAADGFSVSAIGHRGVIEVLRSCGEVVVQQRSMRPRDVKGLLVFAEPGELPDLDAAESQRLDECIRRATQTLLVLPKRRAENDPTRPGWLREAPLLPIRDIERRLATFGLEDQTVLRVDAVRNWRTVEALPWPDLAGPLQLLDDQGDVQPLVSCADGVLLGLCGDIAVLSDPDLLANHGLVRGDNAALVLAALRMLSGRGGIVFDETLHGHRQEPSVLHAAGQMPLALVSVHLLLFAALVVMAARGRFGPAVSPPAPIAAGKAFLIDNVASLLTSTGKHGVSLQRYARMRVRHLAAQLHAPGGLDDAACLSWVVAHLPQTEGQELAGLVESSRRWLAPREVLALAVQIKQVTERSKHAG